MTIAAERSPKARALERWREVEKTLPGQGLSWIELRRRRSLDRFETLGFPTEKTEDWRFTPAAALAERAFAASGARPADVDPARLALNDFAAYRLIFVDGRYEPDLSRPLPQGAVLGSLAATLKASPGVLEHRLLSRADGGAFGSLNGAFFQDGAVLHLAKGAVLDAPVHLLFLSTPAAGAAYLRVLISAEAGSSAVVVEEHAGEGEYLVNAVTEAHLGEGARLEHVRLQRESESALHVSSLEVRQLRGSVFAAHAVDLGARLARHDVSVRLEEEGAECALNGLYVAGGRQHVDNNTVIEHLKPHGTSRELYKGVLDGRARAVFNGTIAVHKDAQKTSALVYNKNLLLSEDGLVNTKPEFKINANDVQCRHGATIGQISADALFYLRSRGLSPEAARSLLVHAFASEMLDGLPVPALREGLSTALHERLPEAAP